MMCFYVARPGDFFCGMDPDERTKQKLIPMTKPARHEQNDVRPEALQEESEA